jgi:creatinine amidohydrolase/Fe(II)-dependent formamide hydrolase-like protein
MHPAGDDAEAVRLRGLIVVLWRAGWCRRVRLREPGYTGDLDAALGAIFAAGVHTISANGVIGDPAHASAEHGSQYWDKALTVTLSAIEAP